MPSVIVNNTNKMEAKIASLLNVSGSDKDKLRDLINDYLENSDTEASDSEIDSIDAEDTEDDAENGDDSEDDARVETETDCDRALRRASHNYVPMSTHDEEELEKAVLFK
jgi:hypothetical protein